MHLGAVAGHFRTCGTVQGTLPNVFVNVTIAIAIFVLIMGISMILIMFRDRWIKLM